MFRSDHGGPTRRDTPSAGDKEILGSTVEASPLRTQAQAAGDWPTMDDALLGDAARQARLDLALEDEVDDEDREHGHRDAGEET